MGKRKFDPVAERKRLEVIFTYETQLISEGYNCIGGVDEAGRGPFVGPVSAACVILKKDFYIPGLNDSKKINENYREELYDMIIEQATAYGIAMENNITIDEINILNATKKAMCAAVAAMKVTPDYLLTDFVKLDNLEIPQLPLVKGDMKSASIAAASILAKVTRDRYMREMAVCYPEYDFLSNKGYGTTKHIEALLKYGPCPLHRLSFIKKYITNKDEN